MSAPRTMSEEQEREDRIRVGHYLKLRSVHRSLSGNDTDGERAFRAWAELDAERAAYSALEQEYESAIRSLKESVAFIGYEAHVPDMVERAEAVLSSPRAQAVKEVE